MQSCPRQLSDKRHPTILLGVSLNMSLRQQKVPQLWKTSCVIPVPKISRPSDFNLYGPAALTAHLVKTLERRPLARSSTDQSGITVEDAVIFLIQRSLSHLERSGSIVRIKFYDFSSAFNTIQPDLLRNKLDHAGVHHHLSAWHWDFLSDRPQFVRTGAMCPTQCSVTRGHCRELCWPLFSSLFTLPTSHITLQTVTYKSSRTILPWLASIVMETRGSIGG